MNAEFQIGNKRVGGAAPCFVIAEIGQNHQGDVAMAKTMIKIAKVGLANARNQAFLQ
jgi:sialic acid synthase SpsE